MAHVLRPTFTMPLPDGATIIHQAHTHKGKHYASWPFVELFEDGRKVRYPLTADGTKYLKASDVWHAEYRDADGKRIRKKGYTDRKATLQLAARLEREAMLQAEGLADPFTVHKKRPLAEHLEDFITAMKAKGNTPEYVQLTEARIRAVLDACKFTTFLNISASVFTGWLADQRDGGMGVQTSNYYTQAMKGFLTWMVRDRRISENPLVHLQRLNAKVDVRRERRSLTPEESARLIMAAHSGKKFRGLTGPDRAMLYLTALGTGFRMAELASLTREAFALEGNPATINLEAAYSKRRREDVQPIRRDLADVLRPWLADKHAKRPVWPGSWSHKKSAVMIRFDLEAARQAWLDEAKENPDEMRRRKASGFLTYDNDDGTADFHALRHTFITGLARGGVHPKMAQALARHSTITLTMDRYSHVGLDEAQNALESLTPVIAPCTNLVPTSLFGVQFPAIVCSNQVNREAEGGNDKTPVFAGVCDSIQPYSANEDDGTRTRNHRIDSPPTKSSQAETDQILTPNGTTPLVPTLYRDAGFVPFPSDLQAIVDSWPTLPEATRQALVRLTKPDLPEHLRLAVLALLDANALR